MKIYEEMFDNKEAIEQYIRDRADDLFPEDEEARSWFEKQFKNHIMRKFVSSAARDRGLIFNHESQAYQDFENIIVSMLQDRGDTKIRNMSVTQLIDQSNNKYKAGPSKRKLKRRRFHNQK